MDEKITCGEFQDWLDRLGGRTVPDEEPAAADEELALLEEHAARCPECAMLLALNRHLAAGTPAELEEQVPDLFVDTMWQRVVGEISGNREDRLSRQRRFRPFRRFLVPAMAASIALLLFASGYLLGELRQLRQSEQQLSMALTVQEQKLEDIQHGMRAIQADRMPNHVARLGLRLGLPQQEDFSASELISLLAMLPREMTMLETGQIEFILQKKRLPGLLRTRFQPEGIDIDDGLQAGEIILLIEWLDIDPGRRIRRDELVSFAKTGTLTGVL